MWQTAYVSSYWRNGPILNGALCGLDEALWDIKAKRAGMPLYELLGGKSRFAIATYCHADGKTVEETSNNVSKFLEAGWKDVAKVYVLAIILDVVYQYIVFRWVYPIQSLLVAFLLAFVPYFLIRGPVNRIVRARLEALAATAGPRFTPRDALVAR